MSLLVVIAGLAVLVVGAELLVRGASRLAAAAGVAPLVIGLTVVAFGTSAPELAVSVQAALAGRSDIALGNVVGSNTFNVLFILGISALIVPLAVARQLIRRDVPVMIGVSVLVWLFAGGGMVNATEGAILVAGIFAYTALLVFKAHRQRDPDPDRNRADGAAQRVSGRRATVPAIVAVLAGLGALVLGARWLVSGATNLARQLGASELVIGLTIVAAGTSLPELATSVVAAIRGERDLAVGNIVGSNIFNLLAVLGGAALVSGGIDVAPAALRFDIPIMVAAAVVCLPVFFTRGEISRWEGALLVGYYLAYTVYLVLNAGHAPALPYFTSVIWKLVVPLTALALVFSLTHALRPRKR
ncbi:MAG: calcium/sodium antiporter [Verrucomicrobia bacterium]|nr:calcium/sodium antiporter [Verrucomicrobiota bacterium]